jgi:O-antigen ligase
LGIGVISANNHIYYSDLKWGKGCRDLSCSKEGKHPLTTDAKKLGKFFSLTSSWRSFLGPIGICAYLIGFAVPFKWDIPLIILALCGILVVAVDHEDTDFNRRWVEVILLTLFLFSMSLSIIASDDVHRSLKFSMPFLPALLVYFLLTEQFKFEQGLFLLFLALSVLAIWLAGTLLWTAWKNPGLHPHVWVEHSGIPVLVTRNDLSLLSVMAPFAAVLLYPNPRSAFGILAILSILVSTFTVVLFQSRGAAVTLCVSVGCMVALLQTRKYLIAFGAFLSFLLILDAWFGFPLTGRFLDFQNRADAIRISHWKLAWKLFLERPLLGHGPHTFGLYDILAPWPHNLYLELMSGFGILGFSTFLALLAHGFSTAWKSNRSAVGQMRVFAAAALAALAAFCVGGAVELSLLRQWVVLMLFLILGVIAQLSFRKKSWLPKLKEETHEGSTSN